MKLQKLFMIILVAIIATSQSIFAAAVEKLPTAVRVDTTSAYGAVSSASATHDSYPASRAFDKNKSDSNGRWLSVIGDNMYLVYAFKEPTLVNALTVVAGHDNKGGYNSAGRAPKSWTFEGSNDGEAWTILDTQTSETGWTNGEERHYSFTNGQAYKFYKYNCTALNGGTDYLQLWELEFYQNFGFENVAITRNDSSIFTISGKLYNGTVGDVYTIVNDGVTSATNLIQTAVEEDSSFSSAISNLEDNKTYQVSLLLQGDDFVIEELLGEIYTGALSFSNPVNAKEIGLVPGGVTVSRANADAYPLTVNYTITSTDATATEGTTWKTPVVVTIPAGSTSAVLPVVPILDYNVNQNITLTISLADGNYALPYDNAANITLINQEKLTMFNFANKREIALSETAIEKIGEGTYTDFPVLLRLPQDVSEKFNSEKGSDLLIKDENGTELSFDVESFDPAGETLVWVKIPSLTAETKLTIFYSGVENYENDSTQVWDDFVGVWHYSKDEAGGTVVKDASANGLDAYPNVAGSTVSTYEEGPGGLSALATSSAMRAPDYDAYLDNVAVFSASGWFKLPSQVNSYLTFFSKKTGLEWNNATGWYIEMSQSTTKANLVLKNTSSFNFKNVSQNWNYFNVVSDGTTVKVYINGSKTPIVSTTYTIKSSGKVATISGSSGSYKEYRVRNSVSTPDEVALEYATVTDAQFFVFDEEQVVDAQAPVFNDPIISQNSDETFSVSVELVENTGDIGVIYESGDTIITNMIESAAQPGTYVDTPTNLPADRTYKCSAYGIAPTGTEIFAKGGIFYNGDITIEKLSDANEYKLVPGVFRISRADTAYDLVVNIEIAGSAVNGQTYEALPTAVTIPAGSTYVDISIVPQIDASIDVDSSVVVSLGAGLYGIDASASSSEMTISNLVAPAGYNTWIAGEDGFASEPTNWSMGRAPIASDKVLFDGDFSLANCEWDSAEVVTVASWTQKENYSGTVTIDTVFPEKGGFTSLNVNGDMSILGGTLTHQTHTANAKEDTYRLRVNVGGDLTVGAAAKITATGKGGYGGHSLSGVSAHGGSYNGNPSYGSLTEPFNVGAGASADATYSARGGGAIWMEVSGTAFVNGPIEANGIEAWGQWNGYAGAGGSVYIKASSIEGSGKISANCNNLSQGSNNDTGAGGRVSILLTDSEPENYSLDLVTAYGGKSSYAKVGGVGTVLVRSPANPNGILYLKDRSGSNKYGQYGYRPKVNQLTVIPKEQTWVVDGIVFGENSILRVPTGTTLSLTRGLESISSTAAAIDESGLLLDGGSLVIPEAENHTISGKWIFQSAKGYTINGNLTVTDGAGVGTMLLYVDNTNNVRTCSLTVTGDMTVDEGAFIRARRGGYMTYGAATVGGEARSIHGGQNAQHKSIVAYDSFFNPCHPGAFGHDVGWANVGGGAVEVVVDGVLTLNGTATASSIAKEARCGAAGTINITAARLEGTGEIAANGSARNYTASDLNDGSGGGGRVAVRLTDADATFTEEWISKINAKGFYAKKAGAGNSSSAGSVYLQDGSKAEGHGLIIIRNTGEAENNIAFTPIPSLKGGGENDDFRNASLSVEATAHVKLAADLKMQNLSMDEGTTFDLNGNNFVVTEANINGAKLRAGVYVPTDEAVAGYVLDTAEEPTGTLKVIGSALIIIVR